MLDAVTGGRDTVGLRVPAHPLTQELLAALRARRRRAVGQPLRPGQPDDGRATSSTTSGRSSTRPRRRARRRAVPDRRREHDRRLHRPTRRSCCAPAGSPTEDVERLLDPALAPTHRAVPGRRDAGLALRAAAAVVARPRPSQAGEQRPQSSSATGGRSSVSTTATTSSRYARELYAELRAADAAGADRIVAVLPPPRGLGHAIRDRLTKAAA